MYFFLFLRKLHEKIKLDENIVIIIYHRLSTWITKNLLLIAFMLFRLFLSFLFVTAVI